MTSETDDLQQKQQEESSEKINELETKPEKTTTENASDVDAENNAKKKEKSNNDNKTKDNVEKLKAKAEEARNTLLPVKKMEQIEELGQQYGEAATHYIIEIGDKSWSRKVKKKALEVLNDINKQSKESGNA